MGRLLHEQIKSVVKSAQNLEDLENIVYSMLDRLDKKVKIAFVAGPISAKTKLGKKYNRHKLDILTRKIGKIVAKENMVALSCAITPHHLQKFSVNNFYNVYDRVSDRGERLYLTGNWRKSKGSVGEYERALRRGIEIFEVREILPEIFHFSLWIPIQYRKILISQVTS